MIIMGACFSPWDGSGDQGNLVINVGDGGSRKVDGVTEYTIKLTNSGETSISQTTSGGTVDFSVQPGNWSILVRATGLPAAGSLAAQGKVLKGYGEADVEVKAGANTDVTVTVKPLDAGVTEMVSAWTDLKDVLEKAEKNETVLLTRNLQVNSSIEIRNGKEITLLAKDNVTITKGNVVANSLFRVIWGSKLTLSVDKGKIIIEGNKANNNSSLFYVGTNSVNSSLTGSGSGTLIMNEGVTLTNNHANVSTNDRGGAVVVQGGTFIMNGGIISKNSANNYGGGVRVLSGTFTKTGGTIYGSDGGDNKNTAKNGGHAVYFDVGSTSKNTTLGPDDKF
jgi:hypothetical protein